jgi:cystathionine beta-synthase
MKQHAISQLPVIDGETVVGLIHERTLLDHALKPNGQSMPVSEIADADFCTVTSNTEVQVLADLLRRFRVALVMQNTKLTCVLSRIDIIDYIAKKSV